MASSIISSRKRIRYFSNLHSIFSFRYISDPSPPLPHPQAHISGFHPPHGSTSLHTTSTGLRSKFSIIIPFSQCIGSFSIPQHKPICKYPLSFVALLRPLSGFRWFSLLSSDHLCVKSQTIDFPNRNKEFEDVHNASFRGHQLRPKGIDRFESDITLEQVSGIIEVIRKGGNDIEYELHLSGVSLSILTLTQIFRVLNCEKIPALHFFDWVRQRDSNLQRNADFCSLIIDNCGWLDDYNAMISLLKEFTAKRICLNAKAFGFLPVLGSAKTLLMESITRIIQVLKEVGGSCCNSGIYALVEMLCKLDSFEMAKFVIEITERKVAYYIILVREKCRRRQFGEVHDIFREMRKLGCAMDAKIYNYLLSSLCKEGMLDKAHSLFDEMQEKGTPPNALTFEILIYYSCRHGKLDTANQLLDLMESGSLKPRLATHASFIRGYFDSGEHKEAYKYVVCSSDKYKESSNMNYSLIARLHQEKGDLIIARSILVEMMEKGLRPHFPVYMRVMKRLFKTGRGHLAGDLKSRFSRFTLK